MPNPILRRVKQKDLLGAVREFIKDRIATRDSNYLIGLSGINCAGKSTLAKSLTQELFGFPGPPCAFDIDDFLHERKVRNANSDQVAGCYGSFDYSTLFQSVLLPAKNAQHLETTIRALNAEKDTYEDRRIHIEGPCVVIAEGIFLYRKDLPDIFDLKIWLEIEESEIVRRALTRNRKLAKHPDVDSILSRYETRFIPAQKYHIEHDSPRDGCDVIFEISSV